MCSAYLFDHHSLYNGYCLFSVASMLITCLMHFGLHFSHIMYLDKHTSKQASKKKDFTADPTWLGSLRLAPTYVRPKTDVLN